MEIIFLLVCQKRDWRNWESVEELMLYTVMWEEGHFFIRIFTSFYSFKRSWSFCGLWDRQWGWRHDRLLYWPITSSLDHSTLRYLQDPLSTSASRPGLLIQHSDMGHRPQRVCSHWLQAGSDSVFIYFNFLN